MTKDEWERLEKTAGRILYIPRGYSRKLQQGFLVSACPRGATLRTKKLKAREDSIFSWEEGFYPFEMIRLKGVKG